MQELGEGLLPGDRKFLDLVANDFKEMDYRASGGYTPPESDPRKCEPVTPGEKGGFQFRIEKNRLEPFPRCNEILCQVRDKCTRLVRESV